jgi:GDP-L-fucose synthase
MQIQERIYVAGHSGLVGSALLRNLRASGYSDVVTADHSQMDLTEHGAVREFFRKTRPDYVFLAAARVGGILANSTRPADFLQENLAIAVNVIQESRAAGVKRLIFLGSSCIYPRACPQPIREEYLLTGPLENTNRAYALAKIAGIEMCRAYNLQYGTKFIAAMPTNLYGPGDNYDLETSHVIPALLRKMHASKMNGENSITLWGSGLPRREFLHVDDLAAACVFLMRLPPERYDTLVAPRTPFGTPLGTVFGTASGSGGAAVTAPPSDVAALDAPIINVGCGEDLTIADLAQLIGEVVGSRAKIEWDRSQPDGTPRKLLDISRMRALGWEASICLHDGLATTYRDYLQQTSSEKAIERAANASC